MFCRFFVNSPSKWSMILNRFDSLWHIAILVITPITCFKEETCATETKHLLVCKDSRVIWRTFGNDTYPWHLPNLWELSLSVSSGERLGITPIRVILGNLRELHLSASSGEPLGITTIRAIWRTFGNYTYPYHLANFWELHLSLSSSEPLVITPIYLCVL